MYDPQSSPPIVPPPASAGRRLLIFIIAGLGVLVVLQVCVLVGLFAFPGMRSQLAAFWVRPSAPAPPEAPVATAAPTGPVLIEDNFDQPTTRWDQSLARAVDGAYELRVDTPNYDSYGLFLGAEAIDDFDMAVDVQQVAGDPTAEYGIRFRQTGPGDYLMFSISGSGYYRLLRVRDHAYQSLVPWTFDGRIKTGPEAVNRLRVVAEGAAIKAWVNEAQLVEAEDEIDVGGQLTLGVTTFDAGGLVVRFDNIAGRAGETDLHEDFNDPEAITWSIGGATIEDGGYEIFTAGGVTMWQEPLPTGSSRVRNFTLDVDAELVSSSGEGSGYGVIFGDAGSFNYYTLYLFPEGGIGLFQAQGGDVSALVPPTQLDLVKPGTNATNTLRLEIRDNVLSISINGEQLRDFEFPEPIEGMVGLVVSAGAGGSAQARFDNFRLEEQP